MENKKSLDIWKVIVKATINGETTEVADIQKNERSDNFTDLIILLCIYYVFAINNQAAVDNYIVLFPILDSLVKLIKYFKWHILYYPNINWYIN